MALDLIESHALIGLNATEVAQLLGEPSEKQAGLMDYLVQLDSLDEDNKMLLFLQLDPGSGLVSECWISD